MPMYSLIAYSHKYFKTSKEIPVLNNNGNIADFFATMTH